MAQFAAEQWIPVGLGEVFQFFCDPENFISIMPPALGARILRLQKVPPLLNDAALADAAGKGTQIEFSFQVVPLLPFRMNWLAEVVEFVAYERFRDVQVRGPLKRWEHTHIFATQDRNGREGTLIKDEIRYAVAGSPFGKIVDECLIRPALASTFAYRRKVIARLLAGGNA